jgi:hypothetical protein
MFMLALVRTPVQHDQAGVSDPPKLRPAHEQPDPLGLLPGVHVDAGLSADTGST